MVYSDVQIAATLYRAGFRGDSIRKGTAIVLAESGGDNRAVGDGGQSRGWWQIYRPAHPTVTDKCAFDPLCSSRYAFRISAGGTTFYPWTTSRWIDGKPPAMNTYIPRAAKAVEELKRRGYKGVNVPSSDARGWESYDLKDAAGDVGGAVGFLANAFDDILRRVGFALVALLLLAVALFVIVKKVR